MALRTICDIVIILLVYLLSADSAATILDATTAASMSNATTGFSMKLYPRPSIDQSLFPKNLTLAEKYHRIAEFTKARALYLRYKISEAHGKLDPEAAQPVITYAYGNLYLAQMLIGSVQYTPYLLVDTGGSDTWFQCEGCYNCFPLAGGNFKYQESNTFAFLSCDHPLCDPRICESGVCWYSNMYVSGQGTQGALGADTFNFLGSDLRLIRIPYLVFGCGLDNRNIIFGGMSGPDNKVAGIFGLAPGPRSVLTQIPDTLQRFSYCLASWDKPEGTYTFLNFGTDATISGGPQTTVQTTPLVRSSSSPTGSLGYYVNMLGISVNGERLGISPSVFQLQPGGSGGVIVDSGAGNTVLVWVAYEILREKMVQYFQQFGWLPLSPGQPVPMPYELCYRAQRTASQPLASMIFHFEGADLTLDPSNVFQTIDDVFCMAIVPTGDQGPTMIGAFQMVDHRFLYDLTTATISFVPEECQTNT